MCPSLMHRRLGFRLHVILGISNPVNFFSSSQVEWGGGAGKRRRNRGARSATSTPAFSVLFCPCIEGCPQVATNGIARAGASRRRMWRILAVGLRSSAHKRQTSVPLEWLPQPLSLLRMTCSPSPHRSPTCKTEIPSRNRLPDECRQWARATM